MCLKERLPTQYIIKCLDPYVRDNTCYVRERDNQETQSLMQLLNPLLLGVTKLLDIQVPLGYI